MINNMKKMNIWYAIYSLLFAGMLVVGRHVMNLPADVTSLDSAYVTDFHFLDLIAMVLLTPLIYILLRLVASLLEYIAQKFFQEERKSAWWMMPVLVLVFMILWFPYLMSYWPGGVYSDTSDSIQMALGQMALDNHNPILYTLIWKAMFAMTGAFDGAGDYPGLKLFTVVQMVLLAVMLASFIYWSYRKGMHRACVWLMVLVAGVLPLYPFYGISLWKDTLFSIVIFIFSLFLLALFRKFRTDISWLEFAGFCMLCILTAFLRNNGIYIVAFCGVGLVLICLRRRRRIALKLGAASLVVVITAAIIQGPVFDACGYNIDKAKESMGIPLQQVAYIVSTDGNVPEEDAAVLATVMPMENWKSLYNPIVVDTIKFDPSFNRAYFETHAGEFFRTYLHLVLKNPVKAGKAYLLETMGFWDISKNSGTAYICNFSFSNAGYCMSDYFDYYLGISFKNLVEPRTYLSSALFAWFMLLTLFISAAKRRYAGMIAVFPTLGLWLSIMIATPVAFSFRYVYALFLCVPIYLMIMLQACRRES